MLSEYLDNYNDLLKTHLRSMDTNQKSLLVIISWMEKYYEDRLEQSKRNFNFINSLR